MCQLSAQLIHCNVLKPDQGTHLSLATLFTSPTFEIKLLVCNNFKLTYRHLDLQSKLIDPHSKFWLIQLPSQSLYQKRPKTENHLGYTGEPPDGATGPCLFLNCFELTVSHFQDHIWTRQIHSKLSMIWNHYLLSLEHRKLCHFQWRIENWFWYRSD